MLKEPDSRSFQAVIFDMDGVIFDTEHLAMRLWIQAAQELGLPGGVQRRCALPVLAPSRPRFRHRQHSEDSLSPQERKGQKGHGRDRSHHRQKARPENSLRAGCGRHLLCTLCRGRVQPLCQHRQPHPEALSGQRQPSLPSSPTATPTISTRSWTCISSRSTQFWTLR